MPLLNDEDQACLVSCMDEIRNVVGESVSERQLVETIMKYKFDCAKALDAILNNTATPPPTKSTEAVKQTKDSMDTGDDNLQIFSAFIDFTCKCLFYLFFFSFVLFYVCYNLMSCCCSHFII